MLWGLDSSYPPNEQQAAGRISRGFRFQCLYVGGNTPYSWTVADIGLVVHAGFSILPIWVAPFGSNNAQTGGADGDACVGALVARGLGGTVCLDVENGAVPRYYVSAFVEKLNAAAYKVCLYGSTPTLSALGDPVLVDLTWLCYLPTFTSTPGWAPADWDMWQFAFGSQADLDVCRDDFPFATFQL